MSPLADALMTRKRNGRCAFVPFLTAGDPSLGATARFMKTLARAGADAIELGVPFSDPVADGPVIQAASQRALRAGATLGRVLALVKRSRREGLRTPVILFTYLNPVLSLGLPRFASACASSGVQAVLIVDLPVEESGPFSRALWARAVELVLLASPTTSRARLKAIGKASGSLVYYVSREGVTGIRQGLAPGIADRLKTVRSLAGKPVIVGFGVSTPAQARALSRHADGVVVGSALVRTVAESRTVLSACAALDRYARRLIAGLGG